MSGYEATSINNNAWNWLRVGSMSGAVALHFVALALLAIPIAIPAPVTPPASTPIAIIERPIEPAPLPIPEEPQPPRRTPRNVSPVRISAPAIPVITADAAIALPVPEVNDSLDIAPAMDTLAHAAAAPAANVMLAYESVVEPRYPSDAKRRGEHGTVLLRVRVGSNGLPLIVEVARSSGSFRLDRAAREAVLRWRFRPVQIDGRAVPAEGLVPIAFNLERA